MIRSWRAKLFMSTLFLLNGCFPTQHAEVDLYRSLLSERFPSLNIPLSRALYSEEDPLTLTQALSLATHRNEQILLKGEDLVQALILAHRAATSFLPTITVQPSFTIEDAPDTSNASRSPNPIGGSSGVVGPGSVTSTVSVNSGYRRVGDTFQRTEVPLVGSLNLFRGFADIESLRAATATVEERKQILFDMHNTVLLNVAQMYYQVLRLEESVKVLKESLRLQDERLEDAQNRLQNGLATKLEVAQSTAERDATKVALIQAESDVRNGRNTLAFLIGVPSVPNVLLNRDEGPEHIEEESFFENQAKITRPDLLAAEAAVVAQQHFVEVAIAQYYPSASLNVAGFMYREFYSDASKWSTVLTVNLPLFSAGQIEADVRTAWSKLRQVKLNQSEKERNALKEVQIAYDQFTTSALKVRELQSQVDATNEAYNQARSAFENGLAINLDVLQAQERLLNAQLQLTSVRFDKIVFYLNLRRATGFVVGEAVPMVETKLP